MAQEEGNDAFGPDGGISKGSEVNIDMASDSQIKIETEQEPVVEVNNDAAQQKPFPIPTHIKLSPMRERERILQTLVHASQCNFARCYIPDCRRLKRERKHLKTCKTLGTKACESCKRILRMCYRHTKICLVTKCPMPFCFRLKQELNQRDQRRAGMATTQTKYSMTELCATILEGFNVGQENRGISSGSGSNFDFQKMCEAVRKRIEGVTRILRMSRYRENALTQLEHNDRSL